MTLTAKQDIIFTFGEVGGSFTFATKGTVLTYVSESTYTYTVRNEAGDEFVINKEMIDVA